MKRIRAAVIGGTGYTGEELCALLAGHPGVAVTGIWSSGRGAAEGRPATRPFELDALLAGGAERPECVFLATPDEVSAGIVPALIEAGVTAIDLSGAFRLRDAALYPAFYGFEHPAPALLAEAVYGLTERRGGELEGRRLVANPGCYATSVLLALEPVLPLLDPAAPIVCDAKSGVSGAGRRSEIAYSFTEVSGNFKAYGVAGHRHEPEIRQEAGLAPGAPFTFVPHLLPVVRGILSTLYVSFPAPVPEADLAAAWEDAYGRSPFVAVLPHGELPDLKTVVGTPGAAIGFVLRQGGRSAVIVSVLDNLLKGAASQAVQNFNRVFGFPGTEGLPAFAPAGARARAGSQRAETAGAARGRAAR